MPMTLDNDTAREGANPGPTTNGTEFRRSRRIGGDVEMQDREAFITKLQAQITMLEEENTKLRDLQVERR